MDRRSFIKLSGAATAAGLTGACGQAVQKIIPYAVPPDEGINPVEGWWYSTSCRMCDAGCGVMVRTVEGRAKKIEGNPDHPVNKGGVCAKGQASAQQIYHPERLTQPMLRQGDKGTNSFKPISWDEAINILSKGMDKAKNGGGAFVLAGDGTDMTAAVAARVLGGLGESDFAVPGLNSAENFMAGTGTVPYYDIVHASTVLSLGADLVENWVSPVHYGWAYGQMRGGNPTKRGQLLYAGPRLSLTAANADHFYGTNQGSLGLLALGIARGVLEIAEEKHLLSKVSESTVSVWRESVEGLEPAAIARKVGLTEKQIHHIAEEMVKRHPSVAIPGDDVLSHSNGVESLKAVELLNSILRGIGRQKNVGPGGKNPELYNAMKEFIGVSEDSISTGKLKSVLDSAENGKKALGIIINANPVFDSSPSLKVASAISNVGFVAQFGLFLDETSQYADLVLPDRHFLESWSAQVVNFPYGVPVLNTIQPVVNPPKGSMQAGDVLIKAAAKSGIDIGVENQETLIRDMVKEFGSRMGGLDGLGDKDAWESLLRKGGWWAPAGKHVAKEESAEHAEGVSEHSDHAEHVTVSDPQFAGSAEYSFFLHPYTTVTVGNGSAGNIPWLLELPEPMTSVSYGSWVEINPKTAAKLGLKERDIVKIESPFGAIEAPVYPYPGIGPNTVAIPFGWGHTAFGKYANGRGENAHALLGDLEVDGSGAPAWRGVKVKVTKTGKIKKMVREAHPEGEYEAEVFQL